MQAAVLAAYRDDGEAAQVCERMVDLDEGFQEWRYRHVKMVERTIGDKAGHRRLAGRRVPAHDAPPADLPRPLGGPQRAVISLDELRRTPERAGPALLAVPRRRAAPAHRPLAPGLAGRGARGPARGVRRRRARTSTRSGSAPSRRPSACATASGGCSASRAPRSRSRQNTHELVMRFLSALDLRARPRLVTTDGEFHTLRRQLARLAEEGLEVVRAAGRAGRDAGRAAGRRASTSGRAPCSSRRCSSRRPGSCPGLDALARACARGRRRAARRRLPRARRAPVHASPSSGWRRPGSSAAATSTSSSARATASCACRRRRERAAARAHRLVRRVRRSSAAERRRSGVGYAARRRALRRARPTTRRATTAPRASSTSSTSAASRRSCSAPSRCTRSGCSPRPLDALDAARERDRRATGDAAATASAASSPLERPQAERSRRRAGRRRRLDRRPRPLPPPRPGALPLRRPARSGDGPARGAVAARRSSAKGRILAAMTETKITLPESAIPERWYNIQADMPNPPQPVLHPGHRRADRPGRPRAALPDGADPAGGLAGRGDPDSRADPRRLPALAADAALPRAPARAGARDALAHLLQVRGRQPGGQPQAEHGRRAGLLRQGGRAARASRPRPAPASGAARSRSRAQLFGLECKVYMVKVSYEQKPYRRSMMETWGASVVAEPLGGHERRARRSSRPTRTRPGSLGIAISEAVEDAAPARGHRLLARQRAQPRAHAPDGDRAGGARADGAGRRVPRRRHRLRRRRLELRRARLPVPAREDRRPGDRRARLRAGGLPDADARPVRLRLRRHRAADAARAHAHARPRLRAGPGSTPAGCATTAWRRSSRSSSSTGSSARRPTARPTSSRRAVRFARTRGDHPGARGGARDPRRRSRRPRPRTRRAASARSSSTSPATATSTSAPTTPTSPGSSRTSSSRRTRSSGRSQAIEPLPKPAGVS